jgi:RHS repeat-associated protein
LRYFRTQFIPRIMILAMVLLGGVLFTIQAAETGAGVTTETKSFKRDQTKETKISFDGIELTVPAGTENAEMTISRGNPDLTGIEIPFGIKLFKTSYRFGPSGLKFSEEKKLKFRMKWNPEEYPGGLPSGMNLYYINRASGKLELSAGAINETTGDFEAEIAHFSEFVPGINSGFNGDGLNPYADYVHAGTEHVGISNLGLTVNYPVYSLPLRGGTQINFNRVFHNEPRNNPFSISNNWSWDLPSYYTLNSRFGPGKLIYKNGSITRFEAGGTVYEVHWTGTPQNSIPDNYMIPGIGAIYFGDGTKIEPRDGYEIVTDRNGNWYRYDYTKFSGKDRSGNPAEFLRVSTITDCLGRVFYFQYQVVDENVPYLNPVSNCPRPYLEMLYQKMSDGSSKPLLTRSGGSIERFTDVLNHTTSYTRETHYYNKTHNGMPLVVYNISSITYPNSVRTEYKYSYDDSYALSRISTQKFYRSGATTPFRAVGYQKADYPHNGAWNYNGEWLPVVTVNEAATTKKYYLTRDGNTHHEDTYDAATQKLLKNVQYTYDGIIVIDYNGSTYYEGTPRPLSVITKFTKAEGGWGPEMVNGYDYDNWANTIYVRDPYGTVTRTLYHNTDSMSMNLNVYGMQNPHFNCYGKFFNKPATQAVIVTDPVHQTAQVNQVHYEYDLKGNLLTERVVKEERSGNGIGTEFLDTRYTYNAYGDILTKTDPKNNLLQFEYGAQYNYAYLTRVYQGSQTLARYDYYWDTGLKRSATDPKGNVFGYTYDPSGRLLTERLDDLDPDVAITKTIIYDDFSNKVTLKFGSQEGLITYDSLFGKPVLIQRKVNSGGYVTVKKIGYNVDGQVDWEEDNMGHRTYHDYDALGRETETRLPGGYPISYAHNWENQTRTMTTTDAKGNTRKQYFDLLDRLRKVEDHPDPTTTVTTLYTYDTASHLIRVRTIPGVVSSVGSISDLLQENGDQGVKYTNRYNSIGQLLQVDYPQDGANPMAPETYIYDAAGNLWKKTTAQGTKEMEYEFHGGYRLKKVTEADGRVVNYTYDANDNLLTQSTTGVTYTYSGYDARNRAAQFTATLDGRSFSFSYDYDTYGRMKGITYPNRAQAVTYNYDELDRLFNIPGFVNSCGYDGDNKLTGMLYANGINNTWSYDPVNDRLTNIGFGSLLSLNYGYDSVGNITRINNDYFDYDGMNRLIWAGDKPLAQLSSATGTQWTYDASENITGIRKRNTGVIADDQILNYDLANRLWSKGNTGYCNDNTGVRNAKTFGSDAWNYSYDGELRLNQVSKNGQVTEQNFYDGSGMRVKKVSGSCHLGGNVTGVDPSIVSKVNLNLDISGNELIKVRMKNSTAATVGQIYFITNQDPNWNEAKHKNFTIIANDTNYTEYTIDMSDVPGWTGRLNQLRLDPNSGVTGGSFDIDYLKIISSAITWGFPSDMQGWNVNNHIINFGFQPGGYVGGSVTGVDPIIVSQYNLNLDITGNKLIKVRMKNSTAATVGQIYFITNQDPNWNEAKHKNFTIIANDTNYTEYTIDMSGVPGWTGTLTQLRLDPNSGVTGGSFSIDYINVVSSIVNWDFISHTWGWKAINHISGFGFQSNNANYYIYNGNNPIMEYTPEGKNIYYIYAGNKRIAEEKDGVVKYYHLDHLGSTKIVTNQSGKIIQASNQDAWGNQDSSLVDNLDDWSKVSYHSSGLVLDTNVADLLEDDCRVARNNTNTSPAECLIYYCPNITKLIVTGLYYNSSIVNFRFYTSSDGVTWTEATGYTYTDNILPLSGWTKRIYNINKLPSGTNYIKIEFPTGGTVHWDPELSQVQIFSRLTLTNNLRYDYTGKDFEQDTGLYYFGARYYDPEVGRFITADPMKDGLNYYAYCNNNPLGMVDPDGRCPVFVITGIVGAVAGGVYGAYTSYSTTGQVNWGTVAKDAAIGGLIGAGAGALAGAIYAGSAAAITIATESGVGVWALGAAQRGMVIEKALGGMGTNFPTIDKFTRAASGLLNSITSIKSMDLAAKCYQGANAIYNKVMGFVNSLAGFNYTTYKGEFYQVASGVQRTLQIAIPEGATAAQMAQINKAIADAAAQGITVITTVVK